MLLPLGLRAQQKAPQGAVSGILLDASNGQALPFANVVLLRAQDSSMVAGAQTGEDGSFIVAPVAVGQYSFRATVLGYKAVRRTVAVTDSAPEVKLGALKLPPTTTQLAGVTVQGERAAVVDNLDKKVINVDKDLSSVGGTAVNVLQNVPSVSVDQNGTVSMRGTSNITVLIDGKNSGAASGGSGIRLEQIPASSIEKVEVVTNPSARYDAAGSGGVINIILKKQKKDGWNGSAIANIGTRDKYNTSLSMNRRTGKLNVFGSYDARDDQYRSRTSMRQLATIEGVARTTDQQSTGLRHGRNHGGRVGLDYTISPEHSVSLTVQPNFNRADPNVLNQTALLQTGDQAPVLQQTRSEVNEDVKTADVSADYKRTWAEHKGRELKASTGYTRLWADVVMGQQFTNDEVAQLGWKQDFRVRIHALNGQVDYTHPLGEKSRLDAGVKTEWETNEGVADFLLQDVADQPIYSRAADRSFAYDVKDFVQAGYITGQHAVGNWSYQGGLRAEYTNTQGDVRGGLGGFELSYLNLFPSATVARTIAQHDQRVQASYSRRLNRPGFMQQLPLPIYMDQRNYRIGDPSLRPEFINSFELGHQITMGGATVTSTLFYRQTNNAIQRFRRIDTTATRLLNTPGVITAEYFQNFGQSTSLGAEMSINQPLAKWWKLTANGSLFRNSITAATGTEASRRNLTGTVRVLNTFMPTPKLDVQLTGNYRAAVLTPQGRLAPVGSVDIALRQRLFQDRAALTLRLSDVFNTQRQRITAYADNFEATYNNKWETQVGYIGFSWYFGSNKPPKKIESAPQGGGGFGG
ncbi:TonB-dependent receptor domain-containing protein [Hymenobacter sp. HD11105]